MGLISTEELPVYGFKKKLKEGLYIDKTPFIQELIETAPPHQLMIRPKGFGKTLFIKTLREILIGNRDAFKGCAIADSAFEWKKHKVIEFDFGRIPCDTAETFELGMKDYIKELCEEHSVAFKQGSMQRGIIGLVEPLGEGQRLAMLIDNYDVPVTKSWHNCDLAKSHCHTIANFLTTLKSLSGDLNFTFVTGEVRLGINTLWSGPNHLYDITLDDQYAGVMGYTLEEVKKLIEGKANLYDQSVEEVLEEMKQFCGAYCFF